MCSSHNFDPRKSCRKCYSYFWKIFLAKNIYCPKKWQKTFLPVCLSMVKITKQTQLIISQFFIGATTFPVLDNFAVTTRQARPSLQLVIALFVFKHSQKLVPLYLCMVIIMKQTVYSLAICY
jgi:hypothetical protein